MYVIGWHFLEKARANMPIGCVLKLVCDAIMMRLWSLGFVRHGEKEMRTYFNDVNRINVCLSYVLKSESPS